MNHTELAETYAARAMHFATRARIHREGLDRCRAAGLKASARDHAAGIKRAHAAVIDAANVVIAELTLDYAVRRAAATFTPSNMTDPFNPTRYARAVPGAGIAYFLPR